MRIVVGLLAILAMMSSAVASDFSGLSKPAFARAMLLSPGRALEAQCAALARTQARLGRGINGADAERIAAEVRQPLLIEVGDVQAVGDLLDGGRFGPRDLDGPDDRKLRFDVMDMMAAKCGPLFDAFRTGGPRALAAKLEPALGLIPLLPLDECVAIVDESATTSEYSPFRPDDVVEIRAGVESRMTEAEKAAFETSVASAKARLVADQRSPDWIEVRSVACFATFGQAMKAD